MNKDDKVIDEFGEEWARYKYDKFDDGKLVENFNQYFRIFPWESIKAESEGFDMGCGSGRWAKFVAPRVGRLNCVEPSKAIEVAKKNTGEMSNVVFYQETTDSCSIKTNSQDFGYCLGVLHHIPDTQKALSDCANLLKPGAPFLLYLYYNFDNKPEWFRALWRASNFVRQGISKLPSFPKKIVCELVALLVYLPLAKTALFVEKFGMNVTNLPLSDYRNKPFYQMRNDALDRFGTRLEQRFSKDDISRMLENSGFERITFSNDTPFWCCISYKK